MNHGLLQPLSAERKHVQKKPLATNLVLIASSLQAEAVTESNGILMWIGSSLQAEAVTVSDSTSCGLEVPCRPRP